LVRQHTDYIAYLKSEGAEPKEIVSALWDWEFERGLRDKPRPIVRRRVSESKIDQLHGWTDKQPWYVQLLMWQFVLVPLVIIRIVIVMFGFGLLFYFGSGAGAP
jgi:hypothetical protein